MFQYREVSRIIIIIVVVVYQYTCFVGAVFLVTTAMLGLNVWGAFMVIVTVVMILVHLIGMMVVLDINANAVSLVNLVMTVGIAVEFSAHIVRWFISCKANSRLKRAKSALDNMGSSVSVLTIIIVVIVNIIFVIVIIVVVIFIVVVVVVILRLLVV